MSLRDTAAGGHLWKTWTYGTGHSGTDPRKGRLTDAVRYNYPPGQEAVGIFESYEYRGGTAGTSQLEGSGGATSVRQVVASIRRTSASHMASMGSLNLKDDIR